MIKILEHTADIGFEIESDSLENAFSEAALGLISLMVDIDKIECKENKKIEITSMDLESLLVKFLSEILYLFDAENFIFSKVKVNIQDNKLISTLCGEKYIRNKHGNKLNVKAVTYHMLYVDPKGKLRVIFDI